MKVEYRLKPVTRFIVTRYEENDTSTVGSVRTLGEYENKDVGYDVAYALCRQEHESLGYPPGDERIQYPREYYEPGTEPVEIKC